MSGRGFMTAGRPKGVPSSGDRPAVPRPVGGRRALLVLTLVVATLLALAPITPSRAAGALGTWTSSSQLETPRTGHTATLLDHGPCRETGPPSYCGQVLVAGGRSDTTLSSAELYDASTRGWTATASLGTPRSDHSATLLDDGRVLLVGGKDESGTVVASATIYEPATFRFVPGQGTARGTWAPTGSLGIPRWGHTATLLGDGQVLITGGRDASGNALSTAELFNPTADFIGAFAPVPSMSAARSDHAAARLADGRVLVTGGSGATGQDSATAEVYDPVALVWRATASMGTARSHHTATVLIGGKVVVAGGGWGEVFNPAADAGVGAWQATAAMAAARSAHTATLLEGPACTRGANCGQVLVVGGHDAAGRALASSELFDPVTGTWRVTGDPLGPRSRHQSALLVDGTVLVTGGTAGATTLASSEVFDPSSSTQPPSVTGLSPSGGVVGGGATVTINGAGFVGVTEVRFGDTPALNVRVLSERQMTVTSPAATAASVVDVTVTTAVGASERINVARYRYAAVPTLTDVEPNAGAPAGGTAVVITGADLSFPETVVRFGGVAVESVTHLSDRQLKVVSPPHAPGIVDITVTTPAGVSQPSSISRFTYGDGAWTATDPLGTARYHHTATQLQNGRVLVAGGTDDYSPHPTVGLRSAELYDPIKRQWRPTGNLNMERYSHTATLLRNGKVLVAGGTGPDLSKPFAEETKIEFPAFATGSVATHIGSDPSRPGPAIRLALSSNPPDGSTVALDTPVTYELAYFNTGDTTATAVATQVLPPELEFDAASHGGTFDPETATVVFPPLSVRHGTTAARPAGLLTVTAIVRAVPGGSHLGASLRTVAKIDGTHSNWSDLTVVSGSAATALARVAISATPPSGSTVTPGTSITYRLAYYNPGGTARNDFVVRYRLPSESLAFVSATGGGQFDRRHSQVSFPPVTVEPGTSAANPSGFFEVTAVVRAASVLHDTAEVYDPDTGEWTVAEGRLLAGRFAHTATLLGGPQCRGPRCGKVLVTGGTSTEVGGRPGIATAELYDPDTGKWSQAGMLPPCPGSSSPCGRGNHTATSLPNGKVLVAGGLGSDLSVAGAIDHQLRASPQIKAVIGVGETGTAVNGNAVTHTLVGPPGAGASPRVMQAADPPSGTPVAPETEITYYLNYFNAGATVAENVIVTDTLSSFVDFVGASHGGTFDPQTRRVQFPAVSVPPGTTASGPAGTFVVTVVVRGTASGSTAVPVPDGSIIDNPVTGLPANSIVHPVLSAPEHGASPRVRVSSSPPAGSTVAPGSLVTYTLAYFNTGRSAASGAVVSLAADHLVSASGGRFDAESGTVRFAPVPVPAETTADAPAGIFTVTAMAKGPVHALTSAEVYDPVDNTWAATAPMRVGRFAHTASALDTAPCGANCGKVLVAGGIDRLEHKGPSFTASAELYDPARNRWSPAPVANKPRGGHSATVLPDGTVLVAGSSMVFPHTARPDAVTSTELYDPVTSSWRNTAPMISPRGIHTTTLLGGPDCQTDPGPGYCGTVLVAGGGGTGPGVTGSPFTPPAIADAEIYTAVARPPSVTSVTPAGGPSTGGSLVVITGTGFNGVSAVHFGGAPALSFLRQSPTRLTATAPPHARATVDVTVTTAEGTSLPSAGSRFTYAMSQDPDKVTDLEAQAVSETDVELSWSAPASDGKLPPPARRYIIKQAASPIIDEATFAAATTICGDDCFFSPTAVGDPLSLSLRGVTPGSTNHYALRAVNEIDRLGPISDPASATTRGPPAQVSEPPPSGSAAAVSAPSSASLPPRARSASSPLKALLSATPRLAVPQAPLAPIPSAVAAAPDPSTDKAPASEVASSPAPASNGGSRWRGIAAWIAVMALLAGLGAFLNSRYRAS